MKIKIKKHLNKIGLAILVLAMPISALAQTATTATKNPTCLEVFKSAGNNNFGGLVDYIFCLIQASIVPLLFVIAMVVFMWGVVKFIMNADNEESREKGRQFMLYGIIGLAVMVSVWGLVSILANSFGIDTKKPDVLKVPQLIEKQ